MRQLRQDPVSGHWVAVAKCRAERPNELAGKSLAQRCPFCPGHEEGTPTEVLVYRDGDTGSVANGHSDWLVRVVPNKYPAVQRPDSEAAAFISSPLHALSDGYGVHEVIIESPEHVVSTAQLSTDQLTRVLHAYRERLNVLKQDTELHGAVVFKNVGAAAGASLEHSHSQLIALPVVPKLLEEELIGAQCYFNQHGRCVFCDTIARELELRKRVVMETSNFVAVCPFASRFSYETWIVPKQHASHFEAADLSSFNELAHVLRCIVQAIEHAADRPAYNYFIHSAPLQCAGLEQYHWHLEIIPRLASLAGFECGSGTFINAHPPEEAADALRTEVMRLRDA